MKNKTAFNSGINRKAKVKHLYGKD